MDFEVTPKMLEIAIRRQDKSLLLNKYNNLINYTKEKDNKISELMKDINKEKDNRNQIKYDNTDLKMKLIHFDQIKESLSEKQNEILVLEEEQKKRKTDIDFLENLNLELNTNISNLKEQLSVYINNFNTQITTNNILSSEIDELKNKSIYLQSEKEQINSYLKSYETFLKKEKDKNENLISERDYANAQRKKIKDFVNNTINRFDVGIRNFNNVTECNKKYNLQLNQLKVEIDDLLQKKEQNNFEINSLSDIIEKKNLELSIIKSQMEDESIKVKAYKNYEFLFYNVSDQKNQIELRFKELQKELELKENELTTNLKKIEEVKDIHLIEINKKDIKFNSKINFLESEIKNLIKEKDNLQKNLGREIDILEFEKSKIESENWKLQNLNNTNKKKNILHNN